MLKRIFLVYILLCLASAGRSFAKQESYYPLEIGNTWTYFYVLYPPFVPPDTVWGGVHTITEERSVNDTLYTIAPHSFATASVLREDANGRIWARVNDEDVLYWDFTLDEDSAYQFISADSIAYEVTIERGKTVRVGGGYFEDVIELHFKRPGVLDGDRSYAFARGVGIVSASGDGGSYEELFSAEIGGRTVTSVDWPATLDLDISLYPNPFTGTAYLDVGRGQAEVVVTMLDVLGRELVLFPNSCVTGCQIEIKGDQLASGLYYLLVVANHKSQTLKVVHIK